MYKRFEKHDRVLDPAPQETVLLPPLPSLKVLYGRSDRKKHVIETDSVTIGSGEDNIIRFENNDTVSKSHARIRREGEKYFIEDTASTNGTFVDGKRIRESVLRDGSVIRIGNVELRFEEAGKQSFWKEEEKNEIRRFSAMKFGFALVLAVLVIGTYLVLRFTSPGFERLESERIVSGSVNTPQDKAVSGGDTAEQYFIKGMAEYNRGNFENAVLYLDKTLKVKPGYRNAAEYVRMARENLDMISAARVVGQGKEREEKPGTGQRITEEVRKLAETYYRKGRIEYANRNFREALKNWKEVLKIINEPEDELYKDTLEKIRGTEEKKM